MNFDLLKARQVLTQAELDQLMFIKSIMGQGISPSMHRLYLELIKKVEDFTPEPDQQP